LVALRVVMVMTRLVFSGGGGMVRVRLVPADQDAV
jgi:hypothetical protein